MYLQCVLISRDKTTSDEQILRVMNQSKLKNLAEVFLTKQYRSNIRTNRKYLDSPLTEQSQRNNIKLKDIVGKLNIQYVFVSPLKADLQTCAEFFGDSNATVSIQPALAPRVNSVTNISEDNTSFLQHFKHRPNIVQLQLNPKWYSTYGKKEQKAKDFQESIKMLENDENYQTLEHFHKRLSQFKKSLIIYNGKSRARLAIIAHSEVLQALTSTGHHQDFKLINNIPFSFGDMKSQFVCIEGVVGQLQNSSVPFCS